VRRPRIGHPLNIPADAEEHAPLRRARRIIDDRPVAPQAPSARGGEWGRFPAGGGLGEAPRTQNAPAAAPWAEPAAPGDTVSIPDGVAIVDANPGGVGVEAVVAVAATLAHLAPGVVRLTIRPLGRFGETIDLFAAERESVVLNAPAGVAIEVIERNRRGTRTVAGVAPSHTLQGEWEWDADAAAFVLARGTPAWAMETPGAARSVPAVIARALAAAIARGDPSLDGIAVQVDGSGSSVWRPAAHGLPVALTARQAWGMSWPHDWDTYRAALDAALDALRPVAWEEETWLLAPQANDPRILEVKERGSCAWMRVDGEPEITVRLSRAARAILVERGLLPARDEAAS
jgi:hypothetical protein